LIATELVLIAVGTLAFLAIGSFTCVIIDRLPVLLDEPNEYGEVWDTRPWREVLGGHSRCSDCGAPVRARDNIPVLSWLVLRGRCRDCGERIGAFHPVVELLCPALFLLIGWSTGWSWLLLPVLWLVPVGLAVAVIDLRSLIVPTRIVWPAFAVTVALSLVAAAIAGEWSLLLSAVVGVATLAGPLFLIWFALPASMGFGDVRLAVLLGWTLGFYAGTRPIAAVFLVVCCFVLASVIGLVVGIVALGARGRKAQVPFGPALIAGALFCIVMAEPILEPFGVYALS
jgi:leader peptidase (prepilin peptidase)/N-methyltransferase